MNRRLLHLNPIRKEWHVETLQTGNLEKDQREDYLFLSGEALCQYLLRRTPESLVISRGPLPYLSGNKTTVGFISPLTGYPHYSIVGGRAAAHLFYLGLDAIVFSGGTPGSQREATPPPYVLISGRAPDLKVEFKDAEMLPTGQRSAFYWLVANELAGNEGDGSVFTLGEGAQLGYASANIAVEAIFHAGRGGAGAVLNSFARAIVLKGDPIHPADFFFDVPLSAGAPDKQLKAFQRNPDHIIQPLLNKYCERLKKRTGGTITKFYDTGGKTPDKNTLPSYNAQRLGHEAADIGSERILEKTRNGQLGCHWCQVDCRHWHWVPVDYAPLGKDRFLDDFEPAYAVIAMLGLAPEDNSEEAKCKLLAEVDCRVMVAIEQMGCDAIDIGVGLAALFEGAKKGTIPEKDVPACISRANGLGDLKAIEEALILLRNAQVNDYLALRAVGDGPQGLVDLYPHLQDDVFTGGRRTLANAGHANALWTFLMPFSRFFSHYSGSIYKIHETLPPQGSPPEDYQACFKRVIHLMLQREFFAVLGNSLSQCGFTFPVFSQEGKGEKLSTDQLLVKTLRLYGISTTQADLEWFSRAFWAQSIAFKQEHGWRPMSAADFPDRIYHSLSLTLEYSPEELTELMGMVIEEWKCQAGSIMSQFGYEVSWKS